MNEWAAANQRHLTAHLARIHARLAAHAGQETAAPPAIPQLPADNPAALDRLCDLFDLSPFARDVLLLCAGMELDGRFPHLIAACQPGKPMPTFSLALAALADAHWSALTPDAPLRRWQLIDIDGGPTLTHSALRLDERILHELTGTPYLDARLANFVHPVAPPDALVPSHQAIAAAIVQTWTQAANSGDFPVMQLCGPPHTPRQAIAAAVCAYLGLQLYRLPAALLPSDAADLARLRTLWQREALLSDSVLLLDGDSIHHEPGREQALAQLLDQSWGLFMVLGEERRGPWQRPSLTFDVSLPETGEQRQLWQQTLGRHNPGNGFIDSLVAQFNLSQTMIAAITTTAIAQADADGRSLPQQLWQASRQQARPRLDDMAQRIDPAAAWDDLILPDAHKSVLREMAVHVRQRTRVYETWDFQSKGRRGLGISALFAGPSGTGKTMAAEVLAADLQLDLYRIDLSAVVSKYIGETEKNLRRVFDAAEAGGAILLFDEADALFGKRSEVKDSHDRHANIEVSYLLQRMEAYRGLAILTSNLKDALDSAFLRRLRFIVDFPFPTTAERAAIWQRIFPAAMPIADLDAAKLAQLNVPGGNIRNIALYAAFLAAEDETPVSMAHVLHAARREYAKLQRKLTGSETEGWL